jgi:hypothetical protein
MLLQLGLEALEQRESIGRSPGEASQNLVVVEPAHFARSGFDDDVAERHLTVAAQGDSSAAAHAEYGGAVILIHAGM